MNSQNCISDESPIKQDEEFDMIKVLNWFTKFRQNEKDKYLEIWGFKKSK